MGALAGIVSYGVISSIQNPNGEIIGAVVVGLVPEVADLSWCRAKAGALASGAGWLLGSLVFGVWMEVGIGAWLFVGAFLGVIAGMFTGSRTRMLTGALFGLMAGAIGELSRYATVFAEQLRFVDMEFILLSSVGVLLNTAVALVTPLSARRPS